MYAYWAFCGVRVLARSGMPAAAQDAVHARGGTPVSVDLADRPARIS
ncbi:hypothetical protein [Sphingomonas qomolangmaensis]|uniref:Uncharacterized protein n=1 Tax=Sphingomonas qomolangmaensis TaxID=2918765 RepID=A0ABY5L9N0_9SPHN|nr:hypothetical protein [Sphingomonas qomolangmaensis]UUL81436.1 hypothetical protein NMP03_09435 [Sphingomonas qomolangmaensis]